MGKRSGPTSAWPGMGSIHPSWVGDDESLDVRPVRSIAAKARGFSKPCVESWVTSAATIWSHSWWVMVGSPSHNARRATVGGGSSARTTSASSFSVAAPRSAGPRSILRHGSVRRAYSDCSH
jgi:hypothetical protein